MSSAEEKMLNSPIPPTTPEDRAFARATVVRALARAGHYSPKRMPKKLRDEAEMLWEMLGITEQESEEEAS